MTSGRAVIPLTYGKYQETVALKGVLSERVSFSVIKLNYLMCIITTDKDVSN